MCGKFGEEGWMNMSGQVERDRDGTDGCGSKEGVDSHTLEASGVHQGFFKA